jgi:hypothetical protein
VCVPDLGLRPLPSSVNGNIIEDQEGRAAAENMGFSGGIRGFSEPAGSGTA